MGLPTIFERPMTTAFMPLSEGATFFARIAEPVGVQGTSARSPDPEAADVQGMEAVDVLVGVDGVQDLLGIDVLGQRQLNENAVDVLVRVQALHERQDLVLGRRLGELVLERLHADLDGLLRLLRT